MKIPLRRRRSAHTWVALAWDPHELLAAVARPTANGIELLEAYDVTLDKDVTLSHACRELAERLRAAQWTSYRFLLGVPRSLVEIISLDLPPATAAQLPALVRNEVYRQIGDLPDDTPIDYFIPENDRTAADGQSTIQLEAGALRPDTSAVIKSISDALGKQPDSIVVRSLAIASLFRRQVKVRPQHTVLLNLMRSNADLSVLDGDRIMFTRSIHLTPLPDGNVDIHHLADEVRMSLFVAPQVETSSEEPQPPEHVYIFADVQSDSQFVEQLADELQLAVTLLNPLAGTKLNASMDTELAKRLTPLIGILCDAQKQEAPLDFANPKEAPPPPRVGRKIAAYAVAIGTVLGIVGYQLRHDVVIAQQAADAVDEDVAMQQQLLKKVRTKTDVLDAVQRWEASQINWLDELRYVSQQLPAAEDAVVQRISLAPSGNGRGVISMSVKVKNQSLIAPLEDGLRDEQHSVSSQRISQSSGGDDLSCQFETSVLITPKPVSTPE
ncbi:MAG: hypothetical protein KDB23_13515 [Planctomycetales bacterium]|nr:hypothetical protein [Planctomycetales bacterium]